MSKPGRNDACHPGSGTKSKRCHRGMVEQSWVEIDSLAMTLESVPGPTATQISPNQLSSVPRVVTMDFDEPFEMARPILRYLERREEVEAAWAVLERQRERWEKRADTEVDYVGLAKTLFSEKRFAALRSTATHIQRELEHFCCPERIWPEELIGRPHV